jgi:hypothetical protein
MKHRYFDSVLCRALVFVVLLGGFLSSQVGWSIPGFTYRSSCQKVLSGTAQPVEILKKSLDGNRWPVGSREAFTFMDFNVLNMIDLVDAGKMQDGAQFLAEAHGNFAKPVHQLEGIARIFKTYQPSLAFCVEISSIKLLREYDQEFLGNRYEEFSIEGNDPRGVDVGLLLRRDLPLDVEMHSHKNLIEIGTGDLVFSRDLPVFILREKGLEQPILIVVGTHFKSQRSSPSDPNGFNKRSLQVKAASLLITEYEKQFPQTPIILTGDFNNDVRWAPEFAPLRTIGLKDSFELASDSVPMDLRGTHFYFPRKGHPSINQLDAIMFNATAAAKIKVKKAKVVHHIAPDGNPYPPPRSYEERETRPSDHLPILNELDLSAIP